MEENKKSQEPVYQGSVHDCNKCDCHAVRALPPERDPQTGEVVMFWYQCSKCGQKESIPPPSTH